MTRRLAHVASVVGLVAAMGCAADGTADRGDFVSTLRFGTRPALERISTERGLDIDVVEKAYDDLLGCLYDRLGPEERRALLADDTASTFNRVTKGDAEGCRAEFAASVGGALDLSAKPGQ